MGLLVFVAVVALGSLVAFARLSVRHPHARKRWVSSVQQLVTHAQSLALLGYVRLDWPPPVAFLIDGVLSLNVFNVPAATCVFGDPHSFSSLSIAGITGSSSTYTLSGLDVYTFVATAVPLVLLLTPVAARGVASWRGHDRPTRRSSRSRWSSRCCSPLGGASSRAS